MNNIIKILLITLGLFLIFGIWYWRANITQNSNFCKIVGDKEILILEWENNLFIFGDSNSDKAKVVTRSMQDYFQRKKSWKIMAQLVDHEIAGSGWKLQSFTPHLVRGSWGKTKIMFITDFTAEEITKLKAQPISLHTDFWVLNKSQYPDFLPVPTEGIIFLGSRKPGEKLKNFAKKNKVPLLSISEVNGFLLEKDINDKWNLKIR